MDKLGDGQISRAEFEAAIMQGTPAAMQEDGAAAAAADPLDEVAETE